MRNSNGLYCEQLLLSTGWARDLVIIFDTNGVITDVRPKVIGDNFEKAAGPVLSGMSNTHSHAFQRAFVGLTERSGPKGDDFWTWRQALYRFVSLLTPEDVEAIAAQLYVDMLKGGFTSVGEFHYLHHAADGKTYDDPAEMSHRVTAAAQECGIELTLLPVLYAQGGFGGIPIEPGQKRYACNIDQFTRIVEGAEKASRACTFYNVGIAPHSLRAVGPEALNDVVQIIDGIGVDRPIHIHIAEQLREVEECVAWCGARPVEWLLANLNVDPLWCLVHATHMTKDEVVGLANSGAVAGICPTTEADLGDGIFPAMDYLGAGGRIGIGSDSHVIVDAVEELRLLEYGQRLTSLRRNLLVRKGCSSTGTSLYLDAVEGGAQALGRDTEAINVGHLANLVVLDGEAPIFVGKSGVDITDTFIFSGNGRLIKDVFVRGRKVISEGKHPEEERIAARFRRKMRRIFEN